MRARPLFTSGLVVVLMGLVFVIVVEYVAVTACGCGPYPYRAVSMNNESQTTSSCRFWAQKHGGRFPKNLAQLIVAQQMLPKSFVTRTSHLHPLVIPPAYQKNAGWIQRHLPGHCEYTYAGRGLRDIGPQRKYRTGTAAIIVVYGHLKYSRSGNGCAVGFMSVRARWFKKSQLPAVFAQNNAARKKAGFPPLIFGPNTPPP